MGFVKIGGIIYDYSEYRKKLLELEKAVNEEVEQAVARYGFVRKKDNLFCNRKLNFKMKLKFEKSGKLKFI